MSDINDLLKDEKIYKVLVYKGSLICLIKAQSNLYSAFVYENGQGEFIKDSNLSEYFNLISKTELKLKMNVNGIMLFSLNEVSNGVNISGSGTINVGGSVVGNSQIIISERQINTSNHSYETLIDFNNF